MFLLVLCVCVYGWVCNGREGRLAYDFLDELRKEFLNSHGGQVARASRPYEFIRFGTFATGLRAGRLRYGVKVGRRGRRLFRLRLEGEQSGGALGGRLDGRRAYVWVPEPAGATCQCGGRAQQHRRVIARLVSAPAAPVPGMVRMAHRGSG